jgi:hypothetical protein
MVSPVFWRANEAAHHENVKSRRTEFFSLTQGWKSFRGAVMHFWMTTEARNKQSEQFALCCDYNKAMQLLCQSKPLKTETCQCHSKFCTHSSDAASGLPTAQRGLFCLVLFLRLATKLRHKGTIVQILVVCTMLYGSKTWILNTN